jgi:acyl-CoA dehydrogenase
MLAMVVMLGVVAALLLYGFGYWAWVAAGAFALERWWTLGFRVGGEESILLGLLCTSLWIGAALLFGFQPWRRELLTRHVMRVIGPMLPVLSDTEKEALDAGTVWWDGELFSGKPAWRKLFQFKVSGLTQEEQAFLDGPVEQVCSMVRDYEITQAGDLPPEAWSHLKQHGFFGMIIPEKHGGLGFSAQAHSAVITKLASRSCALAVTVMVPNSLGPAELILHYGTDAQREHWLPRLACGEEMPCFALTGPENGSDAAAMRAQGVVCKGLWDGEEVLGLRLDWKKRYTTLGPVASVIGLAFKMYDPDHLLGDVEDLGITCALIPSDTPGVQIGDRHDPMGVAFLNGPNEGHDVFVPIDAVIGGQAMAGQGWRMLMDCLAAGRSISLPSQSCGASQLTVRYTGAYSTVREQFHLSVGRFEGVQEALTRIVGLNYTLNSVRTLIAAAVDAGEKPSVLSAVVKAYATESMRGVVTDGMDVAGGAGLSRGPANVLAPVFQASPIGITVEGANILTRTMIIFGQGAIRCHPFVQEELAGVADRDLVRFDKAFWGHVNFVACNVARAFARSFVILPMATEHGGWEVGRLLGRLSRMSSAFAVLADVAMATLGSDLKRKERLAGRFSDAVAWMFLASATAKRFVDEGRLEADRAVMRWSIEHALWKTQNALVEILDNLPMRPAAWLLRLLLFPLGTRAKPPSDRVATEVAVGVLARGEQRLRHTPDMFTPPEDEPGLGALEKHLRAILDATGPQARLRAARREGRIKSVAGNEGLQKAVELGVLNEAEADLIRAARQARDAAIQVDAFSQEMFLNIRG